MVMVGAVSGPERQIRAPKREHVPLFLYETFLYMVPYGFLLTLWLVMVGAGWGPGKQIRKSDSGPERGTRATAI